MIIRDNMKQQIISSEQAAKVLQNLLDSEAEHDRDKEHFFCLGLNSKNSVKYVDLVSLGTLTNSLVHPRETFRLAVQRGVAAIIVGHNHPSGDPTPSGEDIAVTKRLKQAGEILGISVLDHVIIGEKGRFVSLLERGVL